MNRLNAYGYEQNFLHYLDLMPYDGNHFFNYNGLNFLIKSNPNNKNIVFCFHGAVWEPDGGEGINRIIFRGYDYEIENTDIICICDYLLNQYDEYVVNWTLSTKKHNIEIIYQELISYIFSRKQYRKILFTGTSGGGYPSIKFASIYKETALVSNSQLYLELYIDNREGLNHGFNGLQRIIKYYNDELIYDNKDIEKHILQSNPKKVIMYNNILDSTFQRDVLPFINFLYKNKLLSILEPHFFISHNEPIPPSTQHHIQFPDNKKHIDILRNYFQD